MEKTTLNNKQKFNHSHANHRSRMKETFRKTQLEGFSDIEKLEFLLYYSIPFKDTNPIAHALLDEFKTFNGVLNANYESLIKINGVSEHTALFFNYIHEVINYYYKNTLEFKTQLTSALAEEFCRKLFVGSQQEEIYVLCLNNANQVINYTRLAKGTVSSATLEPKELTKFVLNTNSERIIVTHNHPSGAPIPSEEDLNWTLAIMKALLVNNVDVLDHIIVSPMGTYSMAAGKQIANIKDKLPRTITYQVASKHKDAKPYIISKKQK